MQEFTQPEFIINQTLYNCQGNMAEAKQELDKRQYEVFLNRIWNGEDYAPGPFYENTISSFMEQGFQQRVRDTSVDKEVNTEKQIYLY